MAGMFDSHTPTRANGTTRNSTVSRTTARRVRKLPIGPPGALGIDIYVYWVNGQKDTAYYVVLVHSSGLGGIGLPVAGGDHNQGFFQTGLTVNSACYVSATSTNLPPSVHSPGGNEPGQIVTSLQFPMTLWGQIPNGVGPLDFTATYANAANWPNWAISDRSGSTFAQWFGYQSALWNTMRYPPENFTSAYYDMLYRDGKVVRMPDQSKGSITLDTIAAFVIEPPAFVMPAEPQGSAPPSCDVQIASFLVQDGALFHNPDGCLGARGQHQHNMFWRDAGVFPPDYRCDLQRIATKVG